MFHGNLSFFLCNKCFIFALSLSCFILRFGYLISLLLPLMLLSNLRSLNRLAPFSLFADFANIFAYGIVFYFDMEHFHLIQ